MNTAGAENSQALQRAVPGAAQRQQSVIKQMYPTPQGRVIKPGGSLNEQQGVRG